MMTVRQIGNVGTTQKDSAFT